MWVLLISLAFAVALGLHALLCRTQLQVSAVVKFVVAGMLAGGGLALALLSTYGLSSHLISGLAIYAFTCETYIFLFTATLSSVSISLLLTLREGRLSGAAVEERYSVQNMILRRLSDMAAVGLLERVEDGYAITDRGRKLLRAFQRLESLFCHEVIE